MWIDYTSDLSKFSLRNRNLDAPQRRVQLAPVSRQAVVVIIIIIIIIIIIALQQSCGLRRPRTSHQLHFWY
eukprot:COSAG01_NODE_6297_length_3749_cov_16.183014_1_plen_70_part_10